MKKEQNVIIGDIYSTLGSIGLLVTNSFFNFIPGGNIIFMILSSIAGGMLVDDILSVKYQKLFGKIGLITKDNQFPLHIDKEENQVEIKHRFKLPVGITFQDLLKRQDLFEGAFGRKVKIEQEGYYVTIREFKMQTYESKWESIFNNLAFRNKDGMAPKLLEVIETKIGNRFIFKMPIGLHLKHFEQCRATIESAFHKPIKLDLTKEHNVIVQIYDVKYKSHYKLNNELISVDGMTFPLGVSLTTEGATDTVITFNRNYSHMLVCGMTGMGKTAFMRMLTAIVMLKNNTEIYISDLKATGSYNKLKKCKNLKTLIKSKPDTIKLLKEIEKIMNERYKILDKYDMSDQEEYNRKFKDNKMSNIILLIEEFVILSKDTKTIDLLNLLLAQASGAGIYIWLTVQRPDAQTLDTRLKSNLGYTVAFKAKNSSNSGVYLDQGDFRAYTDLHGPGEALLLKGDGDIFFKSYFMNNNEIVNLVKGTYIEKKEDEVIEDERVIPMPPKAKQVAVIERSKVIDLEQSKEDLQQNKAVDLL